MTLTIAIVGRPNVGKSTLFNRLVGKRLALVDPTPGVTRDRREGEGQIGPLSFRVIDTAGLEEGDPDSMAARMRAQTDRALAGADLLLFVIDARSGITPEDHHFAQVVRRAGTPVVLVANKAEGKEGEAGVLEAFGLGFGDPVAISAEHGLGLAGLYEAIEAHGGEPAGEAVATATGPLRLAIIGRPNVGKSTLVNRLLGAERTITGPEPGLTRDSIGTIWSYQGRDIELVDTAGMRRKARVTGRLEKLSVADTLNTVRFAHVVAVVLDPERALDRQDLAIVDLVETEGRAPVVVVNKWDLVENPPAFRREIELRLAELLPQVRDVPLVTLSALSGKDVGRLMPAVIAAFDRWNAQIATPVLNRWLGDVVDRHPPPIAGGGRVKLRYITQTASRPPTFTVFGTRVGALPDAYRRYLANRLREDFDLPGVPVRIRFKSGKNPYAADT
jgi:GTP-binding protein